MLHRVTRRPKQDCRSGLATRPQQSLISIGSKSMEVARQRRPGMRKSNSDQSSRTLFWMGVPLSTSRCCAGTRFAACIAGAV